MNPNSLTRTLILTITFMGVAIAAFGIGLYCFKDFLAGHLRYVLPIPPTGVAAYVFVFNLYGKYQGNLPKSGGILFREMFLATAVSASAFLLITLAIILLIHLTKSWS